MYVCQGCGLVVELVDEPHSHSQAQVIIKTPQRSDPRVFRRQIGDVIMLDTRMATFTIWAGR